jgi:peroxiredoxin
MLLKTELERFRTDFMATAPREVREAMARADLDLAASGLVERALKAGDVAPEFALPQVRGGIVRLSTLLAEGPVVLSFYRGGWCPYCRLELRALERALPDILRLGGSLAAVSPETPDDSHTASWMNEITFPVLTDPGAQVAAAFGVLFDLADELRPIYAQFGHALPDRNGEGNWRLPIPATYVIDSDRMIALAFIDVDYRNRLEPEDIVATLAALNRCSDGRIVRSDGRVRSEAKP